ncbi:TrmH family RNA methyltransferase [Muriicola soli]|uniref:tRNA (guanosine(18)-2'-O)-methyltransferase n=1 Tax=Muriicola soli TaxID=2507538 RepID=A0A411E9N8_9FLAO|nr:RNA methyltransferase [Muriicola soli]QBA64426.1 TrmH family RNA methyltransferase [Muriicola soli]
MEDVKLLNYLETFVSEKRLQRFEEVLNWRTRYITVVMEDVYHQHNASAVIRSADIFGIQDVHLIERRFTDRLDKKIALGAQKWTDIHKHSDTEECIQSLRHKGFRILATTSKPNAKTLEEIPIDQKMAFVFGTEKEGLSEDALAKADELIHIPMVGFTESLNVSVAAAIVLHQMTQKLRSSEQCWRLSKEEKAVIRADWIKKSIKNIDKIVARFHKGI